MTYLDMIMDASFGYDLVPDFGVRVETAIFAIDGWQALCGIQMQQ